MPENNPNDLQEIGAKIKTGYKKGALILLGAVFVALITVIAFHYFDIGGRLFKGFTGDGPPKFPEFEAPTVASKTPTGAVEIPTTAGNATVVFNESDLEVDLDEDITIKKALNAADMSTAAFSYTEDTKTLTIPYIELEAGTTYKITVPKDTVKNGGESLSVDLDWLFTTAVEAAPPDDDEAEPPDDDEVEPPDDDGAEPPPACTENATKENDEKICKGGEWVTCTAAKEGDKSTDGQKECKDGKWQAITAPPPSSSDIQITKASVFPVGFNPLINDTKITYAISAKAKMEIKIMDHTGTAVVTLLDEEIDAGEYFVWWNGTNKTDDAGEVVAPGGYVYKIIAKDPESDEVKDIKTGDINAVYAAAGIPDFEDTTTVTTTAQPSAGTTSAQDAAATVSLQAATEGETAGTGPSVLLYFLFPLGGYIFSRKKRNK